jgi:hypothetical protein
MYQFVNFLDNLEAKALKNDGEKGVLQYSFSSRRLFGEGLFCWMLFHLKDNGSEVQELYTGIESNSVQ